LRFDTILGPFPDEVSIQEGNLYVIGRQIPMLSEKEPGDVPWGDLGVDTVIEATAQYRTREDFEKHLAQGAKRVILCVPQRTPPDITVVMGVNDNQLKPEHRIVSNGSCTAHCAAPVVKILHEAFGIERAFLSTVHAYTNQQRLADVPSEDKRRGRAAAENIIPQETNATQVVTELIPDLAGRLTGASMNVPVPNGSVVDLVCWHEKKVTDLAINEVIRTAAASDKWKGILSYEDDPIVSSDIIRSTYSSTFDSMATMVQKENVSKTLAWYDNGWGYAHRVVDLIKKFMELDKEAA
jgi:glyceraldehyde 3-phosphate dehydrogenase